MYRFFRGPFFNFEVLRVLSTIGAGGAELAECLDAISQITDDDPESWHVAWRAQARRAESFAEEAQSRGDHASARDALLRASNYTRASYYMLTGDGALRPDPRVSSLCRHACDLYRQATAFFDPAIASVVPLEIPYNHHGSAHTLPGYLYLPPAWRYRPGRAPPVVIANAGADSLCEEVAFFIAPFALEKGYAVVVHEGPGQGRSLHQHGLTFRPDWEAVTGSVIDHLYSLQPRPGAPASDGPLEPQSQPQSQPQPNCRLDLDHIAVMGMSLGGYFALRAAASDSRIAACVAIDPVHDLWDHATTQIPAWFVRAWSCGWIGQSTVDAVIGVLSRVSFQMRWNMAICGTFFGLASPAQIVQAMKAYTLRESTAEAGTAVEVEQEADGKPCGSRLRKIRCPVFVSGAGASLYDLAAAGHTAAIYEGLSHLPPAQRQLWLAQEPGEGGLQAKVGAVKLCNQKVFAFLDEQFGIERAGSRGK
ncbi:hypothetical protein QTJ16_006096 [Diplocarpon rosae]|uniref:Xaa-Pro dipeptidyl-peptidase-like domain-containing protein n=1 Tax=Diplocarpon rosae TaxID=946125 RepID=A0AAD9WC53_9HELO|nr:hypothetical protein QTJ16_006096 [Diplocarpon rosae]